MLENNDNVENQLNETTENTPKADTAKVVDAIENEVAEVAEKADEKHQIQMLDYETMELEQLVSELDKLIKNNPVQQIKANSDAIKNAFNAKFGKLLADKKEAFLADGGNSIDFEFSSPIKTEYNGLLKEYKTKREAYYGELDKQLKGNLEKRNTIIDELKILIANGDPKTMYNDYQKLKDTWNAIGPVPKNHYNDTWKTYHHHVERFYDILHLNKDFRELDFKHNLEEKLKLITRAEALLEVEDIGDAFKELQDLHRLWKEEIGPVGKEHRETVWQQFSEATKKLHDRRHDYFNQLKSKHQEIIDVKLLVIQKLKEYDTSKNKTHKHWQNSIKEIETIREQYFEAGKLPYNKSEAIWLQFKAATKKLNAEKNIFYKQEKNSQSDNLKQKTALVELAESIKDNDDWEETTNTMKRIQSDWKKIGHVPRKFSDDIWKRFKGACNHYFDRLNERKNEQNKEQQEIVAIKKEHITSFNSEDITSIEKVQEAIAKWRDLGRLPNNARYLDGKFNKLIDAQLEKLNLGRADIEMMKFKNIIENHIAQDDPKKIDNELFYLRKKTDETVRDMQQLENNLSFISNATADNPLVLNVRKGIQNYKDELDILHEKLNYIKKLDY